MVEFEFLDETLDINALQSYHLSIQLGLDGLSFCIYDTIQKKYISLRHYPNTHRHSLEPDWYGEILNNDDLLRSGYQSSALILTEERSTMVPDPLFKKDYLKEYFRFNLHLGENETIQYHLLKRAEAWTLYPVDKDLLGLFEKRFTNLQVFHHSIPFLDQILRSRKNDPEKHQVHIDLQGGLFDIAVTRGKSLALYNCYSYRHVNDLMYFVLNVFEQLSLPARETPVVLSGKVTRQSSFYENLRRYVKHLGFARRDPLYTYSYTFEKIPSHAYLNLLNLYTCVS